MVIHTMSDLCKYAIAAHFGHIFGVYTIHIFFKMLHKTDMPNRYNSEACSLFKARIMNKY